jgi:hypothetical protein
MATAQFKGEEFKFPDEVDNSKAQAEEKFEIEIEDDTPPEDRGRKPMKEKMEDPTEDELEAYDDKVKQRIKKFTRGYHDERRAKEEALREREAAEAYAKQVIEENKRLQQQLANGSQKFIETTKAAAETRLSSAKDKLKAAFEAGDSDAMANAQAEVADATAALRDVMRMQPVQVKEKEFTPATQAQPQPQQAPVSNRAQKWIAKNQEWFGKDEEMTMAAMGIDKRLQREYGADYVGTKEYFKTIDKTMRKRFPEFFGANQEDEESETPAQEKPVSRASKPATVVAPASRSTPPSRIKLKASEAAIARRLGVPLELYAKQVAQLKRG